MKDILFIRFGVCGADVPDSFHAIADYAFCPDYSDNAAVHSIEHVEDALPIHEDCESNARERAVLTEVFNEARARCTTWQMALPSLPKSTRTTGSGAING